MILHITKIRKIVFQLHHKTVQAGNKFSGLFLPETLHNRRIQNSPLDEVVFILAVRHRILKVPVGKQIKTHLPDILFSQFRKDPGNIIGKHTVGRQDQDIGRFQILPVVIQKIGDTVKRHGGFPASRGSLYHHDPVGSVADNGVLFFLNGADNVLQMSLSAAAQFRSQYLIIDLNIAFEPVDHLSPADLKLPFGKDLALKNSGGSRILCRASVVIIKQPAYRRSPVIDKRTSPGLPGKVADPDIKFLRFFVPLVDKIHTSEEG